MKYPLKSSIVYVAMPTIYPLVNRITFYLLILILVILTLPQSARAECEEYKIVEFEDRVEAVCVGEILTDEQKKANLEEAKRLEAEAQRQRAGQLGMLRDIAEMNRTRSSPLTSPEE